jgi:hypothetical protein
MAVNFWYGEEFQLPPFFKIKHTIHYRIFLAGAILHIKS